MNPGCRHGTNSGRGPSPADSAERPPGLLLVTALLLVLVAAGVLFVGILAANAATIGLSLAAGASALILIWIAVGRASDRSERDRER